MEKQKSKSVLSIYGTEIDGNSLYGKMVSRWRTHSDFQCDNLQEIVYKLQNSSPFEGGFYIMIHKTNSEKLPSILFQGLNIYDDGRGISFATSLSRCYDSESIDLLGDYNYMLNSIEKQNQNGDSSILYILPRNYEEAQKLLTGNNNCKILDNNYVLCAFDMNCFIPGKMIQNKGNVLQKTLK